MFGAKETSEAVLKIFEKQAKKFFNSGKKIKFAIAHGDSEKEALNLKETIEKNQKTLRWDF